MSFRGVGIRTSPCQWYRHSLCFYNSEISTWMVSGGWVSSSGERGQKGSSYNALWVVWACQGNECATCKCLNVTVTYLHVFSGSWDSQGVHNVHVSLWKYAWRRHHTRWRQFQWSSCDAVFGWDLTEIIFKSPAKGRFQVGLTPSVPFSIINSNI